MKVEENLHKFLMLMVNYTNRLPYRSGKGSQYSSIDGRVGPRTGLNALEKTPMPKLGTNYGSSATFCWRPTREMTTEH
jgi:hypothetical protein